VRSVGRTAPTPAAAGVRPAPRAWGPSG
jgi:hypothetical protein